jgi:hypothetical protein
LKDSLLLPPGLLTKSIRDDASHTRARVATQLTFDEEPMIHSDRRLLPDATSTSL